MSSMSGHVEVDEKSYLFGGVLESAYPPANVRASGSASPAFAGDVAAFVAAGNNDDQLYNQIKKCSECGKVCAVSMADCNGCGKSLSEVATTSSNNVFMGFIHGIAQVLPPSLHLKKRFITESRSCAPTVPSTDYSCDCVRC